MKVSEALSQTKQIEGELMRKIELRDSIIKEEQEQIRLLKDISPEQYEKMKSDFLYNKQNRVTELDSEIEGLVKILVEMKTKINRINVSVGIDEKLQQMKYLRIRLSKLMNLVKSGRRRYSSDDVMCDEKRQALNIDEKIRKLEREKSALDAEIQTLNWSTRFD